MANSKKLSLAYTTREHRNNQRPTGASHIYVLGAAAYELLERSPPFTGPYGHD
ncbi:hypothetical protein [Streptomyces sp. NPDC058739]|uniref:hypothetical protein n=1 Tax=Streptomyces sp. NPDC058739 TaxID=3346618 RepID=UPI0036CEFEF5